MDGLGPNFVEDEADKKFDYVVGDDYTPPIREFAEVKKLNTPILFLPIEKNISPSYSKQFLSKFLNNFEGAPLVQSPPPLKQIPTRHEAETLAKENNCGAILFLELDQPSIYPPLKITAKVTLQRVQDDKVFWKGTADYNAAHKPVANSARRFSQTHIKDPNSPDKSKNILRNNPLFIQFAAWHLATHLNQLSQLPPLPPPPPPLTKKVSRKR